jgi:AcrR family transcriptional regulator
MGIVERRLKQKEEVKNSILQAAWQLVKEEGWQALSIRKIADAIEYSVPVIYSHFENKEAILLEFTKEGFDLLTTKLEQTKGPLQHPGQQLEAMAKAYWHFAFEHKEYYQLMFGLGMPACETVKSIPQMKTFIDAIDSVIRQAITQSKKPDADYVLKFHTYWSILHGLVSIQMIGGNTHPELTGGLILQDAVDGFIKGLQG